MSDRIAMWLGRILGTAFGAALGFGLVIGISELIERLL